MTDFPVLVADCVSKAFGQKRVLTSASVRAAAGEVRALFGRNGCGKSTLLRIATGCMQPDSGTVFYGGRARLAARFPVLAREGLFFLPDHDLLSATFSIRRQLELLRARYQGVDVERVAALAGIAERLDQRPHQVSGGELRRAEIAAALVRRPSCFIADEPFRGIAPKDAEDITALIRQLARDGCAVVVTGHEVETVFAAVDHVTWCTSGTTYELGPPGVARTNAAFAREYLGT